MKNVHDTFNDQLMKLCIILPLDKIQYHTIIILNDLVWNKVTIDSQLCEQNLLGREVYWQGLDETH